MASIIDEYRTYLNTSKKIIIFRFSISLIFFLMGLFMVTRVSFVLSNISYAIRSILGWFIYIKYH